MMSDFYGVGYGGGREGELMAGWLVKSPPLDNKKPIFKPVTPKWRRRWFILREGEMPGQYILNYYSDDAARKLKGTIDLDQCFQVDSGLTYNCGKVSLANLFNITTQKRIYYLSADTVHEMNSWVQSLCQACGLRPFQTEDEKDGSDQMHGVVNQPEQRAQAVVSEEAVSASQISGPYMHLSECFTGGGHPAQRARSMSGQSRKDSHDTIHSTIRSSEVSSPEMSLNCGDDSVFLPNSPPGKKMSLRTKEDVLPQFTNLKVGPHPPHRPPKPAGLRYQAVQAAQNSGETYENLETAQTMSKLTNQRESNNNHPETIHSSTSSPSSQPPSLPPQVNRQLKPLKRPVAGSATLPSGGFTERKNSHQFDTLPNFETGRGMHIPGAHTDSRYGAMVERTSSVESVSLESRRNSEEEETIYFYMPSLPKTGDSGRWDIMIPAQDMIGQSIEYLDLDLPSPHEEAQAKDNKLDDDPSTVYKTVDFIKTEAFNKTKKNVEHSRYNIQQS